MNISKTVLRLSVLAALLVLLASVSGISLTSIYARETPSWAVQGIGQDIVNIVAVALLLIAVYFVNKGSVKAFLVWSGVLLYLIYAYVIYAFDVHLNRLFLVLKTFVRNNDIHAQMRTTLHISLTQLSRLSQRKSGEARTRYARW